MKLTIGDIKILSEGKQAKRSILNKYASIEEFVEATAINNSVSSINTYLKQKEIANKTFKLRLVSLLNISYDRLFMSPEEQLAAYVDSIYSNIKEYSGDVDLESIRYIKNKCNDFNFKSCLSKIYWCMGQCHFNSRSTELAVEYLKEAIGLSKYNFGYYIKFCSDLGLVYLLNNEYEKSRLYLMKAESKIVNVDTVDSNTLFRLYYRLGILNNNTHELKLAHEAFDKAISYASNVVDKGSAIANKGMAYKKQQIYDKAIEYYMLALKSFDLEDKTNQAIIYNNIATVLKDFGNYYCALKYAELAISLCNMENKGDRLTFLTTYVQIKLMLNEVDDSFYELIEMILEIDKTTVYKKFVIEAIQTVVNYGKEKGNKDVLLKIKDILKQIIDNNDHDIEYIKDIKLSLYDVYELLYE